MQKSTRPTKPSELARIPVDGLPARGILPHLLLIPCTIRTPPSQPNCPLRAAAADSLAAASGAGASGTESSAGAPVAATGAGAGSGTSGSRADTIRVALEPGQGREVKLVMAEGARVNFQWSTDAAS